VPRKSRHRQLARVAVRRQAERRRRERQRVTVIAVALVIALIGGVVAFAAFAGRKTPAASGTPTPSASPTPVAGVACGGKVPPTASTVSAFNDKYSHPPKMTIDTSKTYIATMVTSCGTVKIELEPKIASDTVNSIVFLVRQHFYDGSTFHRIARDFVVQGGDPTGTGSGGPGYTTVSRPPKNAKYPVGTVAMAKTGSEPPGTAGSQFFIVTSSSAQAALAPSGTGLYAIVGHVISGMNVVEKIARLPIQGGASDGPPAEIVYVDTVTVTVSG
jgi:cyclophilin family peptidyl-prolyl cis-trans isomerase